MNKSFSIVVAVAAAAVLGVLAQRWVAGNRAAVTTADQPAAEATAVEEKPALVIPDTLPQFALADREGKMRTLGDWKGKPLLVNYWATWCAPCRREIPLLNALRAESLAPGLEVIGIAVDFRDDVLAYDKETPIDYPLLIGEEDGLQAVESMGMQPAFPFTVFADSQQRILTVKVGELHRDEAELILGKLAAVDAGTLALADARTQVDAGLRDLAAARALSEGDDEHVDEDADAHDDEA
jgi:thiol-disulfide isomerase/thioredoxin